MAESPVQFAIEGLDEILVKMRRLAPEMQKKALRTAIRKGANLVRDAAKQGVARLDDPED